MPRLTEMRPEETYPGSEYSPDEVEFMMAMERYKRRADRPFPTWHEVLRVLRSLGYRKVEVQRVNHKDHKEHKGKQERIGKE